MSQPCLRLAPRAGETNRRGEPAVNRGQKAMGARCGALFSHSAPKIELFPEAFRKPFDGERAIPEWGAYPRSCACEQIVRHPAGSLAHAEFVRGVHLQVVSGEGFPILWQRRGRKAEEAGQRFALGIIAIAFRYRKCGQRAIVGQYSALDERGENPAQRADLVCLIARAALPSRHVLRHFAANASVCSACRWRAAASACGSEPKIMVNTMRNVLWKRSMGRFITVECSARAAVTQGCAS